MPKKNPNHNVVTITENPKKVAHMLGDAYAFIEAKGLTAEFERFRKDKQIRQGIGEIAEWALLISREKKEC